MLFTNILWSLVDLYMQYNLILFAETWDICWTHSCSLTKKQQHSAHSERHFYSSWNLCQLLLKNKYCLNQTKSIYKTSCKETYPPLIVGEDILRDDLDKANALTTFSLKPRLLRSIMHMYQLLIDKWLELLKTILLQFKMY